MLRSPIYWVETGARGRIGILSRPRAGDWLEDEMKALRHAGVDVLVSLLTVDEVTELGLQDEERHCVASGMTFVSFQIEDRQVPQTAGPALALVERLAHGVRDGRSVGVHCRMGIGRSSMIAAAVLIRLRVDGNEAFARLTAARGLAVPDTEAQRRWAMTASANG